MIVRFKFTHFFFAALFVFATPITVSAAFGDAVWASAGGGDSVKVGADGVFSAGAYNNFYKYRTSDGALLAQFGPGVLLMTAYLSGVAGTFDTSYYDANIYNYGNYGNFKSAAVGGPYGAYGGIAADNSGVYMMYSYASSPYDMTHYFRKYDHWGNLLAQSYLGPSCCSYAWGSGGMAVLNGEAYLLGMRIYPEYSALRKQNASGNGVWEIATPGYGRSITHDGQYLYYGGKSGLYYNGFGSYAYLQKIDTNANVYWTQTFYSPEDTCGDYYDPVPFNDPPLTAVSGDDIIFYFGQTLYLVNKSNGAIKLTNATRFAHNCDTGWKANSLDANGEYFFSAASYGASRYVFAHSLPKNGVCGSSNGQSFSSAPTTNLCSQGPASAVSGTGPWSWTCGGTGGGSSASCSASVLPQNGVCGSSNGQSFSSAPTTNLCSQGSASAVSGTGPWNWTCSGTSGGSNASCSASVQYPPSPSAGTLQGTCTVPGTSGSLSWGAVTGATRYNLTIDNKANGWSSCASPNSGDSCPSVNAPTTALSFSTTPGATYGWTVTSCNATACNPTPTTGANVTCALSGACGSSNGQTLFSPPTSNLCSQGTASGVTTNATTYTWSCYGNGQSGATNASCSANRCSASYGNFCTTAQNSCGLRNHGTITCGGTCTAQFTPPESSCEELNYGGACITLKAAPKFVGAGGNTTLSWNGTCQASACTVYRVDNGQVIATSMSGSSLQTNITSRRSYVFSCGSQNVSVTVGPSLQFQEF